MHDLIITQFGHYKNWLQSLALFLEDIRKHHPDEKKQPYNQIFFPTIPDLHWTVTPRQERNKPWLLCTLSVLSIFTSNRDKTPCLCQETHVLLFLDWCIFSVVAAEQPQHVYSEFDDEFDDVESPIGQCMALYTFEGTSQPIYTQLVLKWISLELLIMSLTCVWSSAGTSEGTISITEGELLSIMEEDKGDGWMRVLRASGEEGYIPSAYVKHTP